EERNPQSIEKGPEGNWISTDSAGGLQAAAAAPREAWQRQQAGTSGRRRAGRRAAWAARRGRGGPRQHCARLLRRRPALKAVVGRLSDEVARQRKTTGWWRAGGFEKRDLGDGRWRRLGDNFNFRPFISAARFKTKFYLIVRRRHKIRAKILIRGRSTTIPYSFYEVVLAEIEGV
ncbi:hypothetical protein U9M48_026383, partial [Paspalum notatum var. saurae]